MNLPAADHSAGPSAMGECAGVEPASLLREPLFSRQICRMRKLTSCRSSRTFSARTCVLPTRVRKLTIHYDGSGAEGCLARSRSNQKAARHCVRAHDGPSSASGAALRVLRSQSVPGEVHLWAEGIFETTPAIPSPALFHRMSIHTLFSVADRQNMSVRIARRT
jgi:hypothetical protein